MDTNCWYRPWVCECKPKRLRKKELVGKRLTETSMLAGDELRGPIMSGEKKKKET